MDVSQSEALAERRREVSEVVGVVMAQQSLQEALAQSGQTLVSPDAARGPVVDPVSGEKRALLRYGDRYGSGRGMGP